MELKLNLNIKQKKLTNGLPGGPDCQTESSIYTHTKRRLLKDIDNVDNSIRDQSAAGNLNILSITDVDLNTDKIATKFCRDKFGFVPKQITSYGEFIKGIAPYQTRSVMIHFNFTQDSDLDKETYRFEVKTGPQKNKKFEETPGGVMWLTFYDNDTKVLVYEFYPQVYVRKRSMTDYQLIEIVRYRSKAKRVSSTRDDYYKKEIMLDGIRSHPDNIKDLYLDLGNITERQQLLINNFQQTSVGYFNEALV